MSSKQGMQADKPWTVFCSVWGPSSPGRMCRPLQWVWPGPQQAPFTTGVSPCAFGSVGFPLCWPRHKDNASGRPERGEGACGAIQDGKISLSLYRNKVHNALSVLACLLCSRLVLAKLLLSLAFFNYLFNYLFILRLISELYMIWLLCDLLAEWKPIIPPGVLELLPLLYRKWWGHQGQWVPLTKWPLCSKGNSKGNLLRLPRRAAAACALGVQVHPYPGF